MGKPQFRFCSWAILAILAGCSGMNGGAGREVAQAAPADMAASAAGSSAAGERRCGWFENPTPANLSLAHADGEWILEEQGGHMAVGVDAMPNMRALGWIAFNGSYGFGCACITAVVGPDGRRVERIVSAEPRPLRHCRADRRLNPR